LLKDKGLMIWIMIFMLLGSMQTIAADPGIVLDGSFKDWKGKPNVSDPKHDIKTTWMDFLQAAYFADEEYLYLQVKRLSAEKSAPWHFNVVMMNGVKGELIEHYPVGSKAVYAPQFDIVVDYQDNRSQNGALVNVSFEGELLESTFSSDNNAKIIEFRVPLASVGLEGQNKQIKFMLKSDKVNGIIDWVPNGKPIIVTTGPTFFELTTIVFFGFVSYSAFIVMKKRKKNVSF